jgi:hypothetical protein
VQFSIDENICQGLGRAFELRDGRIVRGEARGCCAKALQAARLPS